MRIGEVAEPVHVPVGAQRVEQLGGGVGAHHSGVVFEPLPGFGDATVAVVGEGETDVSHVVAVLAAQHDQRRGAVRVAFDEGAEHAAGVDGRVLGRVADQSHRGAGSGGVA